MSRPWPEAGASWTAALAHLRQGFDAVFAAAPPPPPPETEDFLAIAAGELRLGLRFGAIAALVPRRPHVALEGRSPSLLGLAGVRGHLVPVFSLERLLGGPAAARGVHLAPWLALIGDEAPLGLAFERFEGYLRVEKSTVERLPPNVATPFAHEFLVHKTSGQRRLVLDVPAVLRGLAAGAQTTPSSQSPLSSQSDQFGHSYKG